MEIEDSSLYREIEAVINSPVKPVHHTWIADIHVNGETIRPMKVVSVDQDEDYENNFSDVVVLSAMIPAGTYAKRIEPFKDDVDITLYKVPIEEVRDLEDIEATVQAERYTAILINDGNPIMEGNAGNSASEETLNLTGMFTISFQLVNKALEQLRLVAIGGIYRDVRNDDLVRAILTKESSSIDVDNGRAPKGVHMVPASNTKVRDHVVIPQGLMLTELADFVHSRCGGIYSAGLGCYLKGDYWYVFPCYDTTRFVNNARTMTVINVPPNKFPHVERTYRKNGSNLVVLATGEVKFRDDKERQQLNFGNGVRFANADRFMEGFATTKDNKTVAKRSENNNEFVGEERITGINNVRTSERPINANPFLEYSKLARRQGSVLSFEWQNSNPSLVFPGMMIRLYYLDHDEIKEVVGVLLKAHHFTQTRGVSVTDTRYVTQSVLYVFVENPEE